MEKYKISVIVPVYNAEKYLIPCLDSLIKQTYKNLEIIAVNDASTDHSLKILQEYECRYANVRVINLEHNVRQGGARNAGMMQSDGDYISFVDSDDWIEADMYEQLGKLLMKDDYDIISICEYIREYKDGTSAVIKYADYAFLKKLSNHDLENYEREQLLFKGPGVCLNLFKASLLKDNNILFPEGMSYEDNFFVPLVFSYVNRMECIRGPFYHYRENINSTIFRKDLTQLDRLKIERLRYDAFKERKKLNELYDGYEILTLKLYYLITLGTYYKYFRTDFIKKAKELKKDFYGLYPNFKKNKYYQQEISTLEKVKILSMEITPYLLLLLFHIRDLRGKYE